MKNQEKQIKKEALIIYRNNDLFERYIPVVEEALTSLGVPAGKTCFLIASYPKEVKASSTTGIYLSNRSLFL
jgi:hypothetical protein